MSALMFHILIFELFYDKELIQDLIPVYGEVILVIYVITRPKIDFIY